MEHAQTSSGEEAAGFGSVLTTGITPLFETASFLGQAILVREFNAAFPERSGNTTQTTVDPATSPRAGVFGALAGSQTLLQVGGLALAGVLAMVLIIRLVK